MVHNSAEPLSKRLRHAFESLVWIMKVILIAGQTRAFLLCGVGIGSFLMLTSAKAWWPIATFSLFLLVLSFYLGSHTIRFHDEDDDGDSGWR